MKCFQCGCELSDKDFCTGCGADVKLYKKVMHIANMFYNDGLKKAGVRDLSGAAVSLRQALKFNKNHVEARNLLGLVYFEMGETVAALSEWVISKNIRSQKNIADDYINVVQSKVQSGPFLLLCGKQRFSHHTVKKGGILKSQIRKSPPASGAFIYE